MADGSFSVMVETEPDSAGELRPRRFRLGERIIEVAEIVDRWPGVDHLYVKLRGYGDAIYILRHDLSRGGWQLVVFQTGRAPANTGAA